MGRHHTDQTADYTDDIDLDDAQRAILGEQVNYHGDVEIAMGVLFLGLFGLAVMGAFGGILQAFLSI